MSPLRAPSPNGRSVALEPEAALEVAGKLPCAPISALTLGWDAFAPEIARAFRPGSALDAPWTRSAASRDARGPGAPAVRRAARQGGEARPPLPGSRRAA